MAIYLIATIISFVVHFALIVPFINFLYKLKFQRTQQKTLDAFNKPTPIFDHFNKHKKGTPVGGGILIIGLTTFLFIYFLVLFVIFNRPITSNYPSIIAEIKIILLTFISFSFVVAYDELNKIFFWKQKNFFGLRLRHKLVIEIILAFIISIWLYYDLNIDFINIPFYGAPSISFLYIFFAAFVIVAFANAVNITDGLDGLASGIMLFALLTFWVVAHSIIDVPTALFIAIWVGGVMAFLYFNIFPSRIFLGDTGALSFGATFAVIGLILGKPFSLIIIGGVFVIEIATSLLQLLSKKYLKKKLFPVAPLHLLLQMNGWQEPKIVMRFWIISIIFGIVGLTMALLK